jgi:Na+/H+ antiporter NhaD/arsenite permease-like protein
MPEGSEQGPDLQPGERSPVASGRKRLVIVGVGIFALAAGLFFTHKLTLGWSGALALVGVSALAASFGVTDSKDANGIIYAVGVASGLLVLGFGVISCLQSCADSLPAGSH